ncbi:MAG: hypothetical protein IT572_06230 [Deltaproteobacteria bacterium]|nr:hypothetical protein [Deltaproteobacteria bacterium]
MPRRFFSTLFPALAVLLLAAPSLAREAKRPAAAYFPAPAEDVMLYDEKLLEAAELAKLSARKHSRKRCWRAVKNALLEANVIPYRPTSRYAWQAGEELEQDFAFQKLDITDPYEAPLGSLLVYGGGGAGHIEFRVEEGFVSDFTNPRPSQRPLIGVYVSSAAVAREPQLRSRQ